MRFLMIGGFLGAGKTTAIGRIAKHYTELGHSVGIVTNDQAFGLVDTMSLQAQGLQVGEVPGACFCCKFDDLLETINQLKQKSTPDIVITEPVGSCTDLAATVIEPLREFHGGDFEIGPLTVLIKPEHGIKILRNDPQSGFSPKAAYIFLKQLEEADLLIVNKVDKLTPETRQELLDRVIARFPQKKVLFASAKTGAGFEELQQELNVKSDRRSWFMEVDYDLYAEGEAELGWLNAQAELKPIGATFVSIDAFAVQLLQHVKEKLAFHSAEPAHLKVLCQNQSTSAIANLVGSDVDVDLSTASNTSVDFAEVVVNARATIAPETLEEIVRESVAEVANEFSCSCQIGRLQRFRPGRPVPTHRMS